MNILVIGSGGREHAICWKLAQSSLVEKIFVVPGNGGTATERKCTNVSIKSCGFLKVGESPYAQIARHENCTLAVVGPENPLAEGVADDLWAAGIPCVGPKKAAAQLEASKDLAKDFMKKHGVACAASETFTDEPSATEYVKKHGAPVVIKADGLAAGKGVVVALTMEDALLAVADIMSGAKVGDAGKKVVIEDYLAGTEISVLAAVSVSASAGDGASAGTSASAGASCSAAGADASANPTILRFLPARDHKRLLDGAKGPNTGGMGAVCPLSDITPEIMAAFDKDILEPTLRGLIAEKFDYRGFIFFGVMLTKNGPKLLEYNVRLGDPETQAVLPLMDFDFAALCKAITDGTLANFPLKWKNGFVVSPCVVSSGYPNAYAKGKTISVDAEKLAKTGAKIFIAGAEASAGENHSSSGGAPAGGGVSASGNVSASATLTTTGGRVLCCSAHGRTFDEAHKLAYEAVSAVSFEGAFWRKDIGLPGAAESR